MSQHHACFSLQSSPHPWGEPRECRVRGTALETQQFSVVQGKPSPLTKRALCPMVTSSLQAAMGTLRGRLYIFSKGRHADQMISSSWVHSMWMCQACNFGTAIVSKLLMLQWKVEVKEKDSHFTGFLKGLQWKRCLPSEEDMVRCSSMHTRKPALCQLYCLLMLHILSLCSTGCAG